MKWAVPVAKALLRARCDGKQTWRLRSSSHSPLLVQSIQLVSQLTSLKRLGVETGGVARFRESQSNVHAHGACILNPGIGSPGNRAAISSKLKERVTRRAT